MPIANQVSNQIINQFIIYDTHLTINVTSGDAIKITSFPQNESFWVSIDRIITNRTNNEVTFYCTVQNQLIKLHNYNYLDKIFIKGKKFIKEHKTHNQRFNPTSNEINILIQHIQQFISEYGRIPNNNEFEHFINTRLINGNE